MALHIQTGKYGESLAVQYFKEKGYDILFKNWRHKRLEIDIIASCNHLLHFIEVKTRSGDQFGFPETKVDAKKLRFLIDASAAFMEQQPQWQRIQFDVLAITLRKNANPEYFLIEDVYL